MSVKVDDDAAVRHRVGAHLDDQAARRRSARGTARSPRRSAAIALAHQRVDVAAPSAPRSALKRRISSSAMPTRVSSGGRSRISPNCRFQQISCRSLSNTAMPWRTWSSAVCRISRLYWIAALASSSSFSAALVETVRLRSSSDRTSRDEAAPIAEASRCSAKRSSWKSASALRDRGSMRRAAMRNSRTSARALLAEIARDRGLQFLDRDRGAPQPEARRDRRKSRGTNIVACMRSIDAGARESARSRHRRGC